MKNLAILVATLMVTAASHVEAQLPHPIVGPQMRITECAAEDNIDRLSSCAWGTTAAVASQAEPDTRSPGTAALLSVLPGLIGIQGAGSYYAGNTGHGTRHLLIGLASLGLVVAGISTCDQGLGVRSVWEGGCGGTSSAVSTVGALGYLFNWGWSTFVAIRDVRDYNERGSATVSLGLAAQLDFREHIETPRSVLGRDGGQAILSVRILRVAF